MVYAFLTSFLCDLFYRFLLCHYFLNSLANCYFFLGRLANFARAWARARFFAHLLLHTFVAP